jgi:hypothetical protein
VWDEAKAGHAGAGSFGEEVQAHSQSSEIPAATAIADQVWDEDIVAAHGAADTAGEILSQLTKRSVAFNSEVADGSVLGQIADAGTATYDRTTDSLQAIADSGGGGPTAAQIADAVWDEAIADHVGVGSTGEALDGASAPTADAIADAVWDEALADHDAEDSVGNLLNDLTEESGGSYRFTSGALGQAPTGGAGSGAISFTYTLTSAVDGSPIVDADVWVTSDQAGNNLLASGRTNSNGQVTFQLDPGTVYVWRQKPGWNFINPDVEIVGSG